MGLFDEVTVEVPLPDGKPATTFQTKSFEEPYMEKYTIRADGRLIKHPVWYDDGSGNVEKDVEWHGYLTFYDEGRCFRAKFTDGNLVSIEEAK